MTLTVGQIWRHKILGTRHEVSEIRDNSWVAGQYRAREYLVGRYWYSPERLQRTMVPADQWAGFDR